MTRPGGPTAPPSGPTGPPPPPVPLPPLEPVPLDLAATVSRLAQIGAYLAITWTVAGLEWLHRPEGWRFR